MAKLEALGHEPQVHEEARMVNNSLTIKFEINGEKFSVDISQNDAFVSDSAFKNEPILLAEKRQGDYCFQFSIPCDADYCVFPDAVVQVFYCKDDHYHFVPGNLVFADEIIC